MTSASHPFPPVCRQKTNNRVCVALSYQDAGCYDVIESGKLQRQAVGQMQSWSIASRAVAQRFFLSSDRFSGRVMYLSV